MTDSTLRLQARTSGESLDSRRGVVRLSAATMAALGLAPWDAVQLRVAPPGTGVTGAVVTAAPPGTHPFLLLADQATMTNLGIMDGADVDVGPMTAVPAERVVLARAGALTSDLSGVSVDAVRLAMLGKVVTRGDEIDLLPEDLGGFAGADSPAAGLDRPLSTSAAVRGALDWLNRAVATTVSTPVQVPAMQLRVRVVDVVPGDAATVTMSTVVAFDSGETTATSATPGLLGWTDAAGGPSGTGPASEPGASAPRPAPAPPPGLEAPFRALTEWLDLDFHHHDLLDRLGSGRRLGILVTGPAGSGKVSLVAAAAGAVEAGCVQLWGPALTGLSADGAVARIRAAGRQAASESPAVLLIEDIDALVGTVRPTGTEGVLLGELKALVADARIAVVCTTSKPDSCDPRLREEGLLEREIALPLYTRAQRQEALAALTAGVPLATDVDLATVAARTPGFVLADLVSLVHEAGVRAAHRHRAAVAEPPTSPDAPPDSEALAAVDLDGALAVVRPTGAEGGSLDVPDLTLDDVGDMVAVKAALTETVLWPLTHPDTFSRLGVDPPRGVLLYGPPGCGKTFLVRALAGEGQVTVLPVKGAEVLSKWVGESERGLREVFRRARQSAPALVFLDEIDALAPQRGQGSDAGVSDRVVAALLTELDGIDAMTGVSVIGATNRPDLIDSAVLRPGRLERLVFVPPPDADARAQILKSAAKHSPLAADIDLVALGARTEGFSAADCAALIREAALTAMRRSMESAEITSADMEAALGVVRPSLDPLQVLSLEAFAQSRTL